MVRSTAVLILAIHLGLAATANAQTPAYNDVTLAWDANTEPDLAGYIVYWGNSSRGYDRWVDVGNVTQHTLRGLADLQPYYFAVRAYNADGLQSVYSAEVSKIIPLNPDRVFGARSRLFWRNTVTGAVASWVMDGNKMLSGGPVGPVVSDLEWQLAGTGDFNGDGETDLVWHHNSLGWVSIWLLRGDTLLSGTQLPLRVTDTNWRIQAVGDLNRDGNPDLVWQHRTQGKVSVWTMSGTRMIEGHLLTPDTIADGRWKIVGIGDYDQDGQNDLFWRHETTGHVSAWKMNGSTMVSGTPLTPAQVADVRWKVVAVTDFNGDRRPDLVWQHDDGYVSTWILNGTTMVLGKPLIPGLATVPWRIFGAGR